MRKADVIKQTNGRYAAYLYRADGKVLGPYTELTLSEANAMAHNWGTKGHISTVRPDNVAKGVTA
jgi:hypothetical protein